MEGSHRVHRTAFTVAQETSKESLNPNVFWPGGGERRKDMQKGKRSECISFNYTKKGQQLW